MTPKELIDAGNRLYHGQGWQKKLARKLKVDVSTVRRWVYGLVEIPGPVEVAVKCLVSGALKRQTPR